MSKEKRPLTREEWIQKVSVQGREATIREEMIRLGFWTESSISVEEQKQQQLEDEERARLFAELRRLQAKGMNMPEVQRLLQEVRQKRIEASRQKREEQKAEREWNRQEAKIAWERHRASHVIYAGEGVSGGLGKTECQLEKLQQAQLPIVTTAEELAEAMGLTVSKLKWLTYHRNTATLSHYIRFTIPKRNGGEREISAPKSTLRQAQAWIKANILDHLPVHHAAQGFVPGKSIVDNARTHVGQTAVIKMDLQDFFPCIHFYRVRGLFQSFGYSELISTLLALICTEPPRRAVTFGDKVYHVAIGDRQLPQGACTSPGLTNLLCRRLDERLAGLAAKHGFRYSRYADDLTFSCDEAGLPQIGALMKQVRRIVAFEGFTVNEQKTSVLRETSRQTVTGIVVNEKVNVNRREWKTFRALLHNVEKNGLEAENRWGHPRFWDYIKGYASHVRMVRPDLEGKLVDQLRAIAAKHQLPLPGWAKEAVES
ncbi:reverse transcriptase family protein [Laceyella putida]|uniref:RNA-directed DNA polymerase n=1 Tax=Laceyella putida TaxID=110101 RepID=A0ABW2RJ13_9BACL